MYLINTEQRITETEFEEHKHFTFELEMNIVGLCIVLRINTEDSDGCLGFYGLIC